MSETITKLRHLFLNKELQAYSALYHPIDIERVRSEDWQIRRFLLEHPGDETRAYESLCKTLQWKKAFGVHERGDSYFPAEFWELNQIEIAGRDRAGRPIQWAMIRNRRSFRETTLLSKQFLAHILERVDRAGGEGGFTVVHDTNGSGLANVDIEQTKFNNAILEYYPHGPRAIYVVDQPWLLNIFAKLGLSILNPKLRQLVHFVGARELVTSISPEHIPARLEGGERIKAVLPAGIRPLEQCHMSLDLDEKFVNHFYDVYKLPRSNANANEETN